MSDRTKKPQHDEYKMVGKYKVKGAIGEGVNGAVRLGIDPFTGQKVALKFMSKLSMKSRQKERLDREVRFLTLLHHPNIVELIDLVETEEYVIFVMSRVRKGELLKFITDHGCLSEAKFRPLFRGIVSAVDYCHRNSVVHRDLKPENILLDDSHTPKIIDFGLSNLYDNEHLLETFCGSPKYAAPEIISGTKYLGPSVDIWSLGIILFAALVGNLPFAGSTIEKTYQRVMAGKINYPASMSPEAKDYIGRILKVDIAERMTLEEMLNHPWLTKGYDGPPSNFLPPRTETVENPEPELVDKVIEFGYEREAVTEAFKNPVNDPIKNTYFLLREKRDRMELQKTIPVADQHHGFIRDKATGVLTFLFHTLKSKKYRLEKDGFLLDMNYVTDRVIRMGFPTEHAIDTLYLNPVSEVYRYFERFHKDHYRIFNLCPGGNGGYDKEKLGGHVTRFPVSPQGPTFETMVSFCNALDDWLNLDPLNVAAVHGKGDFSRTAIMISSWMLHSKLVTSANEALELYIEKVLSNKEVKSLPPSFRRYVSYYEAYVKHGKIIPMSKLYSLTAMIMQPVPEFDVYGGCDPIAKIALNNVRVMKTRSERHFSQAKGDSKIVLECNTVPLSEDVQVKILDKDRLGAEEMFSFRVNLRFLDWCHKIETVSKSMLSLLPSLQQQVAQQQSQSSQQAPSITVSTSSSQPSPTLEKRGSIYGTLKRLGLRLMDSEQTEPKTPINNETSTNNHPHSNTQPSPAAIEAPETEDGDEAAAMEMARHRRRMDKRMEEESLWDVMSDDDSDFEEEMDLSASNRQRPKHPLEKSHDDSSAVDISTVPKHGSFAAPSSRPNMVSMPIDAYFANRVKITLTKSDLDMEKPDRIPDDFTLTLLMKEPRLRRFTAEDIEETARREAEMESE